MKAIEYRRRLKTSILTKGTRLRVWRARIEVILFRRFWGSKEVQVRAGVLGDYWCCLGLMDTYCRGIRWQRGAMVARQTRYPPEFREEAVALVKSSDRSVAEAAKSLGISQRTLWYSVDRDR